MSPLGAAGLGLGVAGAASTAKRNEMTMVIRTTRVEKERRLSIINGWVGWGTGYKIEWEESR